MKKTRPIYKKQDPLQETHFGPKDTHRLKEKGRKNIFHENGILKKAGVAIFLSYKIDFKTKTVTRNRRALCSEKYAPNIGTLIYIKQILTNKKELLAVM